MSQHILDLITICADELTESQQHTVQISGGWTKSRNKAKPTTMTVRLPGLLQQLYNEAIDPTTMAEQVGSRSKPKSRPPLALEALSIYQHVSTAALRWVVSIRLDPRDNVESNIRALVGAAYSRRLQTVVFDLDTLESLYLEMRTWHRQASVMTGWKNPPFRPRITCPSCATSGSIWTNAEKKMAYCRECQDDWEGEDLHKLADLVNHVAA